MPEIFSGIAPYYGIIIFIFTAEISRTELKGYEEITPPYTIRPKIVHLQYDSKQKYQFVIFDT